VAIKKVTLSQLESSIVKENFMVHRTTTVCFLDLDTGYTSVGVSACMNPEDFDKELGQQIARQNAVNNLWPLEGYARMKMQCLKEIIGDPDEDEAEFEAYTETGAGL